MKSWRNIIYFLLGILFGFQAEIQGVDLGETGIPSIIATESTVNTSNWREAVFEQGRFLLMDNNAGWQRMRISATSFAPSEGGEIRRKQREALEELHHEEEEKFHEEVERLHQREWEYLHLPVRRYPSFYTLLRIHYLLPDIERITAGLNRLFWILSGVLIVGGLVWRMSVAGDTRQALHAVGTCLLLISLMGASGPSIRWMDQFSYRIADEIGSITDYEERKEGESEFLVEVLTGIRTSLDRARERIWREPDSLRSKHSRSFWEPVANMMHEILDLVFKSLYYAVCSILEVLLVSTLLLIVLIEQFRLLLLYLGYAFSPLLIGALALPALHQGVRFALQGLLGVILWPVGWVLCFLIGNLVAQPMIYSFNEIPSETSGAWYTPQVLGTYVWNAYYTDQHVALAGLVMGVFFLCTGLIIGILWMTKRIQKMVSDGGTLFSQSSGGHWMRRIFAYYSGGSGSVFVSSVPQAKKEGGRGADREDQGSLKNWGTAPYGDHQIRKGRSLGMQGGARRKENRANTIWSQRGNTGSSSVKNPGRRFLTRKVSASIIRRTGGIA